MGFSSGDVFNLGNEMWEWCEDGGSLKPWGWVMSLRGKCTMTRVESQGQDLGKNKARIKEKIVKKKKD